MWSLKDWRKKYEKRYSQIRSRIRKIKIKTIRYIVPYFLSRNKMTEQYDITESELKKKVD